MNPYLVGTVMMKDGLKYDYPFAEAITALTECCDLAIVFVASNSEDGTKQAVTNMATTNKKIMPVLTVEWAGQGKEIYSRFEHHLQTVIAPRLRDRSSSVWRFSVDSDEIIHEDSYAKIRELINTTEYSSFYVRRINMYQKFDLCQGDKILLCGNKNVRLAKIEHPICPHHEGFIPNDKTTDKYMDDILLYHYSYMRFGRHLIEKAISFQKDFVGADKVDTRVLDANRFGVFNPDAFATRKDLITIPKANPKVMNNWINSHSRDPYRTIQMVNT